MRNAWQLGCEPMQHEVCLGTWQFVQCCHSHRGEVRGGGVACLLMPCCYSAGGWSLTLGPHRAAPQSGVTLHVAGPTACSLCQFHALGCRFLLLLPCHPWRPTGHPSSTPDPHPHPVARATRRPPAPRATRRPLHCHALSPMPHPPFACGTYEPERCVCSRLSK